MSRQFLSSHLFRRGVIAIVAAGIAIAAGWRLLPHADVAFAPKNGTKTDDTADSGGAAVGGDFILINHLGKIVTNQTYRGRWMLVYFGYTFCPDVCPTELQTVSTVIERLGKLSSGLAPLFVTVDPERDTPQVLSEYLSHFNPAISGLTGTSGQISTITREYHVYYAKVADGKGYSMDHSSYLYLMRPDGSFDRLFPGGIGVDELAGALKSVLSEDRHS